MSASGPSARKGASARSASASPANRSCAISTGLPWWAAGMNGRGGAAPSTGAMVESASGAVDAAAARCRAGGKRGPAAGDGGDRPQPEAEARRDAEVAAPAANRPEEIRLLVGVDVPQFAVRRHELGREQAVDCQSVLAHEEADAAAERQAADAHRRAVAQRDR